MNYFERPYFLYGIIPLFLYLIVFYYFRIYRNRQELSLSNQEATKIGFRFSFDWLAFLRFIPLLLVLIALAGPGRKIEMLPEDRQGIDMMIAVDVSGSMARSNDFLPSNRLEVSKSLIQNFIRKRKNDRIGLVVFAGAAYLQSPLTSDRDSLVELCREINEKSIVEQGTAIGDAILLSTYRLKRSQAKSRVILIITDGVSNTGKIDPLTAKETARHFGIKIYTIGVGKSRFGAYQVDFESLKKISDDTGGLFFRATGPTEFQEVMDSIDKLERDKVKSKPKLITESYFLRFLIPALIFMALDFLIRAFLLRYSL
ncbi:MAG: VWA domain-containing protein [Leptospiraceae bacterium]|nr:VWA domain-containing protein [Leptospiraceae bacterium]MCP5502502.1 VWA domain-containing protein [Leptospiraceae bacterium]